MSSSEQKSTNITENTTDRCEEYLPFLNKAKVIASCLSEAIEHLQSDDFIEYVVRLHEATRSMNILFTERDNRDVASRDSQPLDCDEPMVKMMENGVVQIENTSLLPLYFENHALYFGGREVSPKTMETLERVLTNVRRAAQML